MRGGGVVNGAGIRAFPVAVETRACADAGPAPVPGVGDVVLVASGKGGVGKSTVAVNLAVTLAARGRRVGLVDADVYGPSVARMLAMAGVPARDREGRAVPVLAHGVHAVSVASMLPPEAALVWKGPLVAQAVLQLFHDVAWPGLDLLVVDLPPGTGDVQLTILEQIPVTGALVVTTPQEVAVVDAERGIAMFHQRDIPVFGVVENMRDYVCPCCGERQALFPGGGARRLARRKHVALLGALPLDPSGQRHADGGVPLVLACPQGPMADAFAALAHAVETAVALERRAAARAADAPAHKRHQAHWQRLLGED